MVKPHSTYSQVNGVFWEECYCTDDSDNTAQTNII